MISPILILVASPLQALCTIEAIHKFQIKEYEIKIIGGPKVLSKNKGVFRLLEQFGYTYETLYLKNIWEIFRYAITHKNKYDQAIIGDYIHVGFLLFAILQMRRKGSVSYVDDGNSTYEIIADKIHYYRFKDRIFNLFTKGIQKIKQIKDSCFFTYFEVNSEKWHIERNRFEYLSEKIKMTNTSSNGVYLIGTSGKALTPYLKGITYIQLLDKTFQYVRQQFPNQTIWYCPHRVDKDNTELNEYLKSEFIQLFDTEVSVEFDFILNQVRPECIIGFGSSALYSLHMMFQTAEVYTVKLSLSNKELTEGYSRIEADYLKAGIQILNFGNTNN